MKPVSFFNSLFDCMQKNLTKVLCAFAICAVATSAHCLTIVPTFDSSITNDPNGPAMEAAINAAITVFQTNYVDNLTVNIKFVSDPTVDLGQNQTWGNEYPYTGFLAALQATATTVNDANALSKLTNSTVDPILGGSSIYLTLAQARMLGLDTQTGPDGLDSTVSLNMTIVNLTRSFLVETNYDLQEVAEHEIDEVLGTASSLPDSTNITCMDLFRYDTNLNRSFTTNGDNAYFSVDGTNLWARYNMDPDGDYGDWWSDNLVYWAPPGLTPHPQVQDAFAYPGVFHDLGTNELTALDVVGYTLAAAGSTAPTLSIVSRGAGQITVSWPNSRVIYSLEETTDLNSGVWVLSASGTANPATIQVTAAQKFYRLAQLGGVVAAARPADVPPPATPARLKVHVMRARKT
jgi:hypothetical protein